MILNDQEIKDLCLYFEGSAMIAPFVDRNIRKSANDRSLLSFGVSSYGYDVRLDSEIKVFHTLRAGVVDPKRFDPDRVLLDLQVELDNDGAKYVILPPNGYLLGKTMEYFKIPRNIQCFCVGKSTYARCGVLINVTPIEAGFEGKVVIEIANGTPLPVKIYLEEGIAQFFFLKGEPCKVSYSDRGGKYQGQTGVQLPLV